MRRARAVLPTLTILISLAASLSAAAQQPGEIVDRVLEAYGGRERLEQVSSYRFEGTMQVQTRDEAAAMIRTSRGPTSLEVMIHYPDRVEIRTLLEGRGWRGTSQQTLEQVQGVMLQSMQTQAMRSNVPWVLDAGRDHIDLIDHTDEHYLLGIRIPGNAGIRFWIEVDTHRVIRTESVIGSGSMVLVFATDFSDFREVEGILFPFHEESFAQGTHTASIDARSVHWNPDPQPDGAAEHPDRR